MQIGDKIKKLRMKLGITQETLAQEMGVTYQAVSKWENNNTLPDIMILPKLSVFFGVPIDEFFELTRDERMNRIDNMLENERVLSERQFKESLEFLLEQIENDRTDALVFGYLARLYQHRIFSDREKASEYAKQSIELRPEVKDFHYIFQCTDNAVIFDWNAGNRYKIIEFYKSLVKEHPEIERNYLYLMDNLIADMRLDEAKAVLNNYSKLGNKREFHCIVYQGLILRHEGMLKESDECFMRLITEQGDNHYAVFSYADHLAKLGKYEESIPYYEKAFALSPHPKFNDELHALAHIYEILGDYKTAIKTWDRVIKNTTEEFNIFFGEMIDFPEREKIRLQKFLQ